MMTWSNCRIEGRIEVRLDIIYVSEGGNWMVGNKMDKVELGEVLSDHKPVSLEGRLLGEVNWAQSYFKVNMALVETQEGKAIVERAMEENVPWLGVVTRIRRAIR
eukprot:c11073_g1_i1 orf=3-317(+)